MNLPQEMMVRFLNAEASKLKISRPISKDYFKTLKDGFIDLHCKIVNYDGEKLFACCSPEVNMLAFSPSFIFSYETRYRCD